MTMTTQHQEPAARKTTAKNAPARSGHEPPDKPRALSRSCLILSVTALQAVHDYIRTAFLVRTAPTTAKQAQHYV